VKTYTLTWKEWTDSLFGQPNVAEDFVPYSDNRCLVTCGENYRELSLLVDSMWAIDGREIILSDPHIEHVGNWVRLGHMHDGHLAFSEGWDSAHQPFNYDGKLYYTDNAPDAKIYCDGEIVVDHWGEYIEVGNPWIDDGTIWFEARRKGNDAPQGWEIWSMDLATGKRKYVCPGANPCVYNGRLYYAIWGDRKFNYAIRD